MVKKLPFTIKQLIEIDGCVRCEVCREECSLYKLSGTNPHPLLFPTSCGVMIRNFRRILRSKYGLYGLLMKILKLKSPSEEDIWKLADSLFLYCSVCGRCSAFCPLGIDTHSLIISMRRYFIEFLGNSHCAVEFLSNLHDMINKYKNVFGIDNNLRGDWALYTGADVQIKSNAETVYFVGCVSSFQGRAQDIAYSITVLLNRFGEDWTLLQDEWCCGHPVVVSGGENKAREIVKHNVELIESIGAKKVVTGCPGCYLALKYEWPKLLNRELGFKVIHITELIDEYLRNNKIKISKINAKLTYHDPCELGRLGGILEQPRRILRYLTDELVEPDDYGKRGVCCGSGGMLKAVNPSLTENLAIKRFKKLKDTGAKLIVSACPTCIQAFEQAKRKIGDDVQIIDIAELVSEHLE